MNRPIGLTLFTNRGIILDMTALAERLHHTHREIELGKTFTFFEPKPQPWLEDPENAIVSTGGVLKIPGLPELNALTYQGNTSSEYFRFPFLPFDPLAGYTIDQRDGTIDERRAKLEEYIRNFREDLPDNPGGGKEYPVWNFIGLSISSRGLSDQTWIRDGITANPNRDLLERLRVQLYFPDGQQYEAQSDRTIVGDFVSMDFSYFYPLDTGPLPSDDEVTNGHMMGINGVPNAELKKIKGKLFEAKEGIDVQRGLDPDSFVPPRLRKTA